jgi:hypothetical protein
MCKYKDIYYMSIEKTVSIRVVGEVPEYRLPNIVRYLARAGLEVDILDDNDPVSPSIAAEYVGGPHEQPVLAVTGQSVLDFVESQDPESRGAASKTAHFMDMLFRHIIHDHAVEPGGLNRIGMNCIGCNCPLTMVETTRYVGGIPNCEGIDPASLVKFSEIPYEEARQRFSDVVHHKLGPKRYDLTQQLAGRLKKDMPDLI